MEDEKTLQGILEDKLEREGYDVAVVDDGIDGMKAIEEGKPDLILLDMLMPRMGGLDVLEKMHAENLSSIPVIVISNSGQPVEIDRALALGVKDYIIKVDFDPAEVVQKVNTFFTKPQGSVQPASQEPSSPATTAQDGGLEAEAKKMEGAAGQSPALAGNGVRVLLVEDDDFLRGICEHKLRQEGYDVSISADGLDAYNKIEKDDFDLVLLDVILPGMNGFDVLEQTKKNPAKADLPIIMLTNMGQDSEIKKGKDLGAEDYIIKAHFSIDEIIEKMQSIVDKKKAG